MKQVITKTPKNVLILHKLISSGLYKGFVGPKGFELTRKSFPTNFGITGILYENGKYIVKSNFIKPLNYFEKIFNLIGILISIGILIFKSNWVILLLYFGLRLISYLYIKVKREKEIELFTIKFLEFKNSHSD